MESHLSYPALAYYRSQHSNQSWLAALTTVLDASAFAIASFEGAPYRQARLTFAIARHAVVDLAQIFRTPPRALEADRLSDVALAHLREALREAGMELRDGPEADAKLRELRKLYEPYVVALGRRFLFAVPEFTTSAGRMDNWRTSAWERVSVSSAKAAGVELHEGD